MTLQASSLLVWAGDAVAGNPSSMRIEEGCDQRYHVGVTNSQSHPIAKGRVDSIAAKRLDCAAYELLWSVGLLIHWFQIFLFVVPWLNIADDPTVEQGLHHLLINSSNSVFFNKTDLEQYLCKLRSIYA